jgi:hypothetical protein
MKMFYILATSLFIFSCSKTLDINDFSSDFYGYESEIKIEAVILPTENTAIVRIDRSYTLNDTTLFDCLDNDGDWDILFDDLGTDGVDSASNAWLSPDEDGTEGNGIPDCGEPHVDEYDEVLPKIHITDCTVAIKHNNETCEMVFDSTAGSFFYNEYKGYHSMKGTEIASYGAYVPNSCSNVNWQDFEGEYSFTAECPEFEENGLIISNTPIQISQPVVFFDYLDFESMSNCQTQDCLASSTSITDNDTLFFAKHSDDQFLFYASLLDFPYFQLMQFHQSKEDDAYYLTHEHPFQATDVEHIIGNVCLIPQPIVTDFVDFDEDEIGELDVSKYVVYTFSESFTNYYFFDLLDIQDPERSNLRDASGNTIMGTFGSMTSNSINLRIVDCELDSQHPICQGPNP